MTNTLATPVPEEEVRRAIRAHYQDNASMHVVNSRLMLICSGLIVGLIAISAVLWREQKIIADTKPFIVRINDVGRAEVVSLANINYTPQALEMKNSLLQFVTLYYSRIKTTAEDDFSRSLRLVEAQKANAIMQQAKQEGWISNFITSGSEETKVRVLNIVLEPTEDQPYKARVDFEKVFLQNRLETRKERWVASFVFYIHPTKESAQDFFNPLGFSITDFREDKAVEEN